MAKNHYIISGIMSGLVVGGLMDLLFKSTFFWLIFLIFGITSGIAFSQREKHKSIKHIIKAYLIHIPEVKLENPVSKELKIILDINEILGVKI